MSNFEWNSLFDVDINTYAENFTREFSTLCDSCIPSKLVTIRANDPPWFHNGIRKAIRQRRRIYKKAKRSSSSEHWQHYKRLRNDVNTLVRTAKESHYSKLAEKIRSESTTCKDFWKLLKHFTNPSSSSSNIPPLIHEDTIYESDTDKANILNSFFQSQTILDAPNHTLPKFP